MKRQGVGSLWPVIGVKVCLVLWVLIPICYSTAGKAVSQELSKVI